MSIKQTTPDDTASGMVTIPASVYAVLSSKSMLLDIILHDHTPDHAAVDIVKSVIIDHKQGKGGTDL